MGMTHEHTRNVTVGGAQYPLTVTHGPKYPHIFVRLAGEDGNAFSILGRVALALRSAGITATEINEFMAEARSADYGHLLRTVIGTVAVQ